MKKILVVDDSKLYLTLIAGKLKESGFEPLQAKDGNEGLEIALKEKPDLIILDVVMPEMDGFAMLGELRKDDWGGNVPVVMLSGLSHPKESEKAKQDDALLYLVKEECKPEDIVTLVGHICQMMEYMEKTNMEMKSILNQAKQKLSLT